MRTAAARLGRSTAGGGALPAVAAAAAVVVAVAALAAPAGSVQAAEARLTIANDSGDQAQVLMTETPGAAVLQPWPRVLEAGEDMEATFSFPDLTDAFGQVHYAIDPAAGVGARSCLFRWRVQASGQVSCLVTVSGEPIGAEPADCIAAVVEQADGACDFSARFRMR